MLDASGVLQTQNLTWGEKWNKNVGCFPGAGSWQFFLEPPPAECRDTVMRHHHGGGGSDGEDGAAVHLFGAVFLNPGCTLESPQAFFFFLNTLSEPHPRHVILEL